MSLPAFCNSLTEDGKPNLNSVEAFVAKGNQGIVYEANRWHSPMCALDQVLNPSGAFSC